MIRLLKELAIYIVIAFGIIISHLESSGNAWASFIAGAPTYALLFAIIQEAFEKTPQKPILWRRHTYQVFYLATNRTGSLICGHCEVTIKGKITNDSLIGIEKQLNEDALNGATKHTITNHIRL